MSEFVILINEWMISGVGLVALGCFLRGVVNMLFSPCHPASIPLILGYVAGQDKLVEGRQAALYAGLFTLSLFMTIAPGILLIVIFGLGHCIPIVIACSSTTLVRRLIANASWQHYGTAFRRLAGVMVGHGPLFRGAPLSVRVSELPHDESAANWRNRGQIPRAGLCDPGSKFFMLEHANPRH